MNKIEKIHTKLNKTPVFIRIMRIRNLDVPMILVQHTETGECIAVATMNIPKAPRKEDEIFIKQDEFGVFQLLEDEGLISLSNDRIQNGTGTYGIVCTMTDKLKSLI